jgi:hypothetical protein
MFVMQEQCVCFEAETELLLHLLVAMQFVLQTVPCDRLQKFV